MATTNDNSVVDLGRLKTFKSKLDASMEASSVNAATSPRPGEDNYKPATSDGDGSCAMGNQAQAIAAASVAVGINSNAKAETAIAIGYSAVATGLNSTALGRESQASGLNSVALGADSFATALNEVSVGNSALNRRISHVSEPAYNTDAATKKYVDNAIKPHIIAIENLMSQLTIEQLADLNNYWPDVMLAQNNTHDVYFPSTMTTNDQGINIYTLYSITDTTSNLVATGTDHTTHNITQINIEDENGNISFVNSYSVSPVIATNPRFTDNVSVFATGTNSVAAGNEAQASGINSIAIGNIAKAYDSNTVAVGNGATALGLLSIALGLNSNASYASSIAMGPQTTASHTSSVAFGAGTKTDRNYQVSIGDKASGVTRYLSNVKDPVEDQDAATRYWTKNADRSDVFATNYDSSVAGGTGEFYLEANADLNWFAVRGYVSWSSFATAWGNMVRLPGTSDNWWIKTALKVPTAMIPKTNFLAYCSAIDYLGDHSVPYSQDHIAVGTDGYIYVSSWATNHGSTPLGILCLGHRFYM